MTYDSNDDNSKHVRPVFIQFEFCTRDSHKFFFKIKSLSLLLSFFFLMYIRVYIWIMYVCMCMRVCSSCAVLKYFPMKLSLIFISWIASKICFYHATKKDPRNPCFYIWKKIQESSFFFSSVFCSIHLWAISAIIAHQYF